ncbi:Autoimmune regulator [Trema orientale]|uniref:Autoimmune regulator n=1 Tax=Trema orientale TaxID=63057 RepID=A0A2P5C6E6_TREOI|nr:Autoimmune regulator [Trema orientale]
MLIQYSLPSSIEAAIFCLSDHGKQDVLCDWVPGAETWQMCPIGSDEFHGGCKKIELITEEGVSVDHSCLKNFPEVSSQLSSFCSMSTNSSPNLVYKRRKLQGNSITTLPGQGQENTNRSGDCFSIVSCSTPSILTKEQKVSLHGEHEIKPVGAPTLSPLLNSKFADECSVGKVVVHKAHKSIVERTLEVDSVNDSCSSSKSNADYLLSSIQIEVDETSECSSSSAVVMEYMSEDISEMEFCVRILKSHGLLGRDSSMRNCVSPEDADTSNSGSYNRPCKICGRSETTIQLLICDNCEEAFHLSCCNPRAKKIPYDEWFCQSCVKKRGKISKGKMNKKLPNITNEVSGCKSSSAKSERNPIALMLRDRKAYTTTVRIGKNFQAEVPEWRGPIDNDDDCIGEPLQINPSEFGNLHDLVSNNPCKVSSVGNWLQCQQVLDGSGDDLNETICGKWRRAPLFELQTDNWECFCSVRWDPTYADCAVPQELETEEVLKQLKYVEKLRPRLSRKQQKSDHTKSNGNLRNRRAGAEIKHCWPHFYYGSTYRELRYVTKKDQMISLGSRGDGQNIMAV